MQATKKKKGISAKVHFFVEKNDFQQKIERRNVKKGGKFVKILWFSMPSMPAGEFKAISQR